MFLEVWGFNLSSKIYKFESLNFRAKSLEFAQEISEIGANLNFRAQKRELFRF